MYGGSVAHQMDSADEIVRKLLRVAVDRGASDIHLETVSGRLQARFRIDGMLQHFNLGTLGDDLSRQRGEVLSRIKILATLDIAERRRPQDGSFRARVEIDGRVVPMDFRVPVIPSYYGENAALRILDPRAAPDALAALKLSGPATQPLRPRDGGAGVPSGPDRTPGRRHAAHERRHRRHHAAHRPRRRRQRLDVLAARRARPAARARDLLELQVGVRAPDDAAEPDVRYRSEGLPLVPRGLAARRVITPGTGGGSPSRSC